MIDIERSVREFKAGQKSGVRIGFWTGLICGFLTCALFGVVYLLFYTAMTSH